MLNSGQKKYLFQKQETYQTHKISEEMSQSEDSMINSCNSSLIQKISLMKQNIKVNQDQDVDIITNKEFQTIRNLVRPHQCIVLLCQALLTILQMHLNQSWSEIQKTLQNIKNLGHQIQEIKVNELNQSTIDKAQDYFDKSKEAQFKYYETDNINKEIFSFVQKANSSLYKIINDFIKLKIETQDFKQENSDSKVNKLKCSQISKSSQKVIEKVGKQSGIIDSILISKNIENISNEIDFEKLSRHSKSQEKLFGSRYEQVMNIRVKKPIVNSKIKLHQSLSGSVSDFNCNKPNDIKAQIQRSKKTSSKIKGEIAKTWHLFEKENLIREQIYQKQKQIEDIDENFKLNQQLKEQLQQQQKQERKDIVDLKQQSIQDLRKYKLMNERRRLELQKDDIKKGETQSKFIRQDNLKAKQEKREISIEKKQKINELRKQKSKEKQIQEKQLQMDIDFNYQQSLQFKQKQVLSEEDKLQKQLQKSLQLIKSLRKK